MTNIVIVEMVDQIRKCPQIYVNLSAYFCYFIKRNKLMTLSCLFPYPFPLKNGWQPMHFHYIWQKHVTRKCLKCTKI